MKKVGKEHKSIALVECELDRLPSLIGTQLATNQSIKTSKPKLLSCRKNDDDDYDDDDSDVIRAVLMHVIMQR